MSGHGCIEEGQTGTRGQEPQQLLTPARGHKRILHLIPMSEVKQLTLSESTPMPIDYATRLSEKITGSAGLSCRSDIRAEERKGSNQ